jgi:hypothetical protein
VSQQCPANSIGFFKGKEREKGEREEREEGGMKERRHSLGYL